MGAGRSAASRADDEEHGVQEQQGYGAVDPPAPLPRWHVRACFPRFRFCSVMGVAVVLQLAVYFVSLWGVTPRNMAQPTSLALWKLGSSDGLAERCASEFGGKFLVELRRLVTPIFLHGGVMHIMLNLYFELMSLDKERKFGSLSFACLFLVSGICGNLLSDAFMTNGVGASTSCYGLIGADVAQVWLVWGLVDQEAWRSQVRSSLMMNAGMLLVWEFLNWDTIDHFGHLGGFLSGFALGVALVREGSGAAAAVADQTGGRLPSDLGRKRLICGGGLIVGMVACGVKIFLWGSHETIEMGGATWPWKVYCDSIWKRYGQTG